MNKTLITKYLGIVFVVLFLAVLGSDAASGKSKFRFNPPDGQTVIITSKATKIKKLMNRSITEINISKDKLTFNKTPNGYDIVYQPISNKMTQNGEEPDEFLSSIMEVLNKSIITFKINAKGEIIGIDGVDRITEEICNMVEETYPEYAEMFDTILPGIQESLTQESITEWKQEIESFLGRTVNIGDEWTSKTQYDMPIGNSITAAQKVKISKRVKRGGRDCVQVTYSGILDEYSLADALDSWAAKMSKEMGANSVAGIVKANVTKIGSHIVDPATMLFYEESSYEAADITLDIPGRGEMQMSILQTKSYIYNYVDGTHE